MQGCRFNVQEFSTFVSGRVKIKPEVTDDWEVFTGGFKNKSDVLNLRSKKLGQTIYDIGTDSFLKFMREESVVMRGNQIEGRFIIGKQRVLRKESDYLKTMLTIKERKSTLIEKKDLIVGHKYETVCGSTFVYLGAKYVINYKQNPKEYAIELTKLTKKHFTYEGVESPWSSGVSDLAKQKVVKDHGMSNQGESFLAEKLSKHLKNAVYVSDDSKIPELELEFVACYEATDYIETPDGKIYKKSGYSYYETYNLLVENINGNFSYGPTLPEKYTDNRSISRYHGRRLPDLNLVKKVKPVWCVKC